MIRVWGTPGCPHVQRTHALLVHLGERFDAREVEADALPDEFLALSPTRKIPLMEEERLVLYESQVINDYLAESRGLGGAYPADAVGRARHRLAMGQFDRVVAAAAIEEASGAGLDAGRRAAIERELEELERTLVAHPAADSSLLAFHLAPQWIRFGWFGDRCSVTPALVQRRPIHAFLERAAAHPAVVATTPDPAQTMEAFERHYLPSGPAGRHGGETPIE